jgi:HEAT repeat protein
VKHTFILIVFACGASLPGAGVSSPTLAKAWTILQTGVQDKSPDRRATAVRALGIAGVNMKTQSIAEKALKDDNREVRVEAATALGKMHAVTAKPALKEALKDKEAAVVLAAANALYQMNDPIAYEIYYAILTGKQKSSKGLIQSQLDILHDRKQLEKLAFETGIGFVPFGSMSYQAWKTITHDDSSAIRALAAERLAKDPDAKSGGALMEFCTDKKWQVRAAAVSAIAERGDAGLADPLNPLLEDSNDTVRYETAAALIRLSAGRLQKRK